MAKDKHSVDRKAQYRALRDAGFSSTEANRLKGASPEKVRDAIQAGQLPEKVQSKVTMGPSAPETSKGYRPPKEKNQRNGNTGRAGLNTEISRTTKKHI